MEGLQHTTYLVSWIVANVVGLLILAAALKKPTVGRGLFILLFGWACWANYTTVHENPDVYLDYATLSIQWYSDFILGWFKDHITTMVTAIAVGQFFIALGMVLKGWWVKLACIGAIVFLLSIAPLGVGAGFPFSITVSIAAWIIYREQDLDYIWKFASAAKPVKSAI